MKRDELKLGALLSYIQMALSIIISILYTPIMLKALGDSEYGLYNMVSSTISMLSLLGLGFNAGYVRYYSVYKKSSNKEAIWKLNGLFLMIFSIIGIIAFLCGAFLTINLDLVFDQGLSVQEYEIARVLMVLLTINLSFSFPASVFTSIISANEKFIFLKILGFVKTILSPLVILPLLLMGYRSIVMVSVTITISLLIDIVYVIYVLAVMKNKFLFRGFEKGLFKNLLAYTSFIAINAIVDQINWNVDKVVLGRFKGTMAVSVYSIGYTIYNYYMMFSTSISGIFTPRVHKIINDTVDNSTERRTKVTELFVKIGRVQFVILALVSSGLVFFGKEFITCFWAGNEYEESYYVLLLLMIPATIPLIQNLGIEIQRALNRHQFRSIVYLCMAGINLAISIVLVKKYGAVGSAIGTAIALILANGIIMNLYYHFKCNINILLFWKNILRMSIGLIIPIFCGCLIREYFDLTRIGWFLTGVLAYTMIYCISMWTLSLNREERSRIIDPLKKLLRKRNDKN